MEEKGAEYRKICHTALLCARFRAEYTNIPYAREIYEAALEISSRYDACKSVKTTDRVIDNPEAIREASVVEARYVSTSMAIGEEPTALELASGLSPRGLEFSKKGPYTETDLDEMARLKLEIVRQINGGAQYPIKSLNPVSREDMSSFGKSSFRGSQIPLKIINEGLMLYLSDAEQSALRDNVALFLKQYSPHGFWITPDFSSRDHDKGNKPIDQIMESIESDTGRKLNRFSSDGAAMGFLAKGGLIGEAIPNVEIADEISCLSDIEVSDEELETILNNSRAWRVRLAN